MNHPERACRDVAASMASYRGPDALEELIQRLHDALQCDASILIEQTDPLTAVCRFCVGGNEMLRSLSRPSAIQDALQQFTCIFHADYQTLASGDPIISGWGARSVFVVPIDSDSDRGAALLLLWKTNKKPDDLQDAINPAWALLQALHSHERAFRESDEARSRLVGILEAIPQAVAFVDDDGVQGWINHQAAELLGLKPGSTSPAQFSDAMRRMRARVSRESEGSQSGEQLLWNPSAEVRDWTWELLQPWCVLSLSSSVARFSHFGGRIWMFADITTKRVAENALAESRRFSERILSTTPNIIYLYDLGQHRNLYANDQFARLLGYSPEEIHAMDDLLQYLCHPDDLFGLQEHYERWATAEGEQVFETECRVQHADGSWLYLLIRESPFKADDEGRVTQVLGIAADITRRMTAENELRQQEQRWQLALNGTNDGIWDWNAVTGEVFYSRRWKEMLGFGAEELSDRANVWEELVHPEDLPGVKALIEEHLNGASETYVAEYRIRRRDGSYMWVLARGKAICDDYGRPLRMVGAHADITERKEAEERLSYFAAHDALTGLPNRRQFLGLLESIIARPRANQGTVTLCVCDIDYFKQVNDTHGHNAGDEVLVVFGKTLRDGIRKSDVVARMGGDEFYVLFTDTNATEAAAILDRIRERWAKVAFTPNTGINFVVTSTFGVAELLEEMNSKALIEAADQALYRAKQRGRNRVEGPVR